MKVVETIQNIERPIGGAVVTVGFFDGVHLGHRQIISRVVEEAKAAGLKSVLVTFGSHPMTLVDPDRAPALLSTPVEKLSVIESLGVDTVAMLNFDTALRGMTAEEFTEQILRDRLGTKIFVAGYDTKFGKGGRGDLKFLNKVAPVFGFRVVEIEPVTFRGIIVSSTAVRNALSAGDVAMAMEMLGYPYVVSGEIVHGAGNGAKLGFRTANIKPPDDKLIPRMGVYVALARCEGEVFRAAVSIGLNPSVRSDLVKPSVEAHLVRFAGNIYGKFMELEFIKFIRPEKKFDNLNELIERIQIDVSIAEDTQIQ